MLNLKNFKNPIKPQWFRESMLLLHFSSADHFSMLHQLKLSLNEEMTMTDFLGWMPDQESNGDFLCLKSVYLCALSFQHALRVQCNILIPYNVRQDPRIAAELLGRMRKLVEERRLAFTTWFLCFGFLLLDFITACRTSAEYSAGRNMKGSGGAAALAWGDGFFWGDASNTHRPFCLGVRGRTAWLYLHLLHCEGIAASMKGLRTELRID